MTEPTPKTGDGPYEHRLNVILESSRTAHDELLFRVKHRDDWLRLQLVVQAALLGVASGVEVAGIRSTSSLPDMLALAVPSGFVLGTLYVAEDRLVSLLSRYRAQLGELEVQLAGSRMLIPFFEGSKEMQEFLRSALPVRGLALFVVFAVIPAGLATYRFARLPNWSPQTAIECALDAALLLIVLFLLGWSWWLRLRPNKPQQATAKSEPRLSA